MPIGGWRELAFCIDACLLLRRPLLRQTCFYLIVLVCQNRAAVSVRWVELGIFGFKFRKKLFE